MSTTVFGQGSSGRDASQASVDVFAFGKHPGWDDHIEDFGLSSPRLAACKQLLYSGGIAGNIDAGAWESLPAEKRLDGYDHWIYWRTSDGWLICRLRWSIDGKGRTAYPMIVGALLGAAAVPQGSPGADRTTKGASLRVLLEQAAPAVEVFSKACAQTKDREGVRSALEQCKTALGLIAARAGEQSTVIGSTPSQTELQLLSELVVHPQLHAQGREGVGLYRILYEMQRELAAFRPAASRNRSAGAIAPAAQHLRVPRCLEGERGVRAWAALLRQELSSSAPIMLIDRVGEPFIDIVVGEPTRQSLFCLRASIIGLSLASDVPYDMPESFLAETSSKLAAWASGKSTDVAPAAAASRDDATRDFQPTQTALRASLPTSLKIGIGLVSLGAVAMGLVLLAPMFAPKPPTDPTSVSQTPKSDSDSTPVKSLPATPPASGTQPSTSQTAQGATPSSSPASPSPAPSGASVASQSDPKAGVAAPGTVPIDPSKPAASASADVPAGQTITAVVPPSTPSQPTKPAPSASSQGKVPDAGGDIRAGWAITPRLQDLSSQVDELAVVTKAEGVTIDDAGLRGRLNDVVASVNTVKSIPATAANANTIRAGMDEADKVAAKIAADLDALQAQSRDRLVAYVALQVKAPPVAHPAAVLAWKNSLNNVDVSAGWEAAKAAIEAARARQMLVTSAVEKLTRIASAPPMQPGLPALVALEKSMNQEAVASLAQAYESGDSKLLETLASRIAASNAFAAVAARVHASLLGPSGATNADAAVLRAGEESLLRQPGMMALLKAAEASASLTGAKSGRELIAAVGETIAAAPSGDVNVVTAWADAATRRAAERITTQAWTAEELAALHGRVVQAQELSEPARANLQRAIRSALSSATRAAFNPASSAATKAQQSVWLALADAHAPAGDSLERQALNYNVKLFELKSAAAAEVPAAAAAFIADPAFASAKQANALYAIDFAQRIGKAVSSGVGSSAGSPSEVAADLAKRGPGAAGWTCEATETVVIYSSLAAPNASGGKLQLVFRPLPGSGEQTSYLCTSELSVAAAARALTVGSNWEEFAKCSSPPEKLNMDPRRGPRTWAWVNSSSTQKPGAFATISRATDQSRGWLVSIETKPDQTFYAPALGMPPLPPTGDAPLQYISPSAALLIARTLNCRLPTVEEWTIASRANLTATANRRDASWTKQRAHLKSLGVSLGSLESFSPTNISDTPEPAVEGDDGILWFSPVNAAAKQFEHMVGNVSEYVLAADIPAAESVAATAAAIGSSKLSEQVRVIGSSALSSINIKPEEAYSTTGVSTRKGMSDVGMRLAFWGPKLGVTPGAAAGAPASQALLQAVAEARYAPWP